MSTIHGNLTYLCIILFIFFWLTMAGLAHALVPLEVGAVGFAPAKEGG